MQLQQIEINQKKVFYRSIGEGAAVVLLHGFGEDGLVWKNQFHALPGFKLIIPDLPGSGSSEMTEDMSMEGMSETIRQLLVQINIEKCILVGHSMGGYVALAFAEKYSDILNGFGLFHSTAYPDSEEKKETRRKGISFIEEHGAFEFLKASIPNLYSKQTKEQKPEYIEEQIEASHNFSGAALVMYYRSMMKRPDRKKVLEMSKVPVLFILGRNDIAVPIQDGLQLCHLPSLSYIHILENSGHMGMIEERNDSNQFLLNYLKSVAL